MHEIVMFLFSKYRDQGSIDILSTPLNIKMIIHVFKMTKIFGKFMQKFVLFHNILSFNMIDISTVLDIP